MSHSVCVCACVSVHGLILKPPREYLVREADNPKITFKKLLGL